MNGINSQFGIGNWLDAKTDTGETILERLASRMLKEQDADESGDLTLDETELGQEGFNTIDKDGDGIITLAEIEAGLEEKKGDVVSLLMSRSEEFKPYGPPRGRVNAMASDVLGQLDGDGSSDLTIEETNLNEEEFSAVDTDGDGVLSQEEIEAAIRNRLEEAKVFLDEITSPGGDPAARAERAIGNITANAMAELDADGSGTIARDETEVDDTTFDALDTDGDGILSSEEIAEAIRNNPELARRFLNTTFGDGTVPEFPEHWANRLAEGLIAALDADGSGNLEAGESGLESENFDAMDTNGDGTVSAEELAQAVRERTESARELIEENMDRDPRNNARMRRAMASYRGNMGDLMGRIFNVNEENA